MSRGSCLTQQAANGEQLTCRIFGSGISAEIKGLFAEGLNALPAFVPLAEMDGWCYNHFAGMYLQLASARGLQVPSFGPFPQTQSR